MRGDDRGRFLSKIIKEQGDGCWLFQERTTGGGYAQFFAKRKMHGAHRWSYLEFVGPIPEGYVVDHLCKVKNCVRPDHLEAVTAEENQRRRRLTVCWRGHDRTDPANLYVFQSRAHCRACRTENAREARAAREVGEITPRVKPVCKNGHDTTDEANLYTSTVGETSCRPCRTAAANRHKTKNRDKINARRRELRAAKREQVELALF